MEREEENADGVVIPKFIQTYSDLVSTLPVKRPGTCIAIRQLQGFWFLESIIQGILAVRDTFRPRPGDIFLASYPKCGTTWLKALMFAAMTRTKYPPTAKTHPLLAENPHYLIPYLEGFFAIGQSAEIEAMASPRIISTHIPCSLLPDAVVTSTSCRIVYVCRDPKDVLTSICNFPVVGITGLPNPVMDTFAHFCEGAVPFGPIWQHAVEFWRERQRRPDKILFLWYEEMMQDPAGNLKKLAEFMGVPFSADEEKEGVVEDMVCLCSFKRLKELEVNKVGTHVNAFRIPNSSFFRKGEVGDWKNHITAEMAHMMDRIAQSKWQGSGLGLKTTPMYRSDAADDTIDAEVS